MKKSILCLFLALCFIAFPLCETAFAASPATLSASKNNAIVLQPDDLIVYPKDTAHFSVVASGRVKSYRWQYCKNEYTWKDVTVSTFPSAVTDTLTFTAEDTHDNFQYRCVVTFADGSSVTSEPARITVANIFDPFPAANLDESNIVVQPQDVEVRASTKVSFFVVVSDTVKSYQWQYSKNGYSWKNVTNSTFPSAVTDTLTFDAQRSHNGFQYRCFIRYENGSSELSDAATITVK